MVVLDEIQTCPRALTALKYCLEEQPGMAVCAAGSLIGLAGATSGGGPSGAHRYAVALPLRRWHARGSGPVRRLRSARRDDRRRYRRESMFKLYLLDVGLLHHILGVPAVSIVSQSWGSYKGYAAENYAAVQLRSSGIRELYTWAGRASEIEFLLPAAEGAVPLENKSGSRARRARSLSVYREKYAPPIAVTARAANYHREGGVIHLPLYAIGALPGMVGLTGLET